MAEGLRSHWHQFYEDHYDIKYDEEHHCDKKIVYYRCMICGREHVDIYFSKHIDAKHKSTKALEKNKRKHYG